MKHLKIFDVDGVLVDSAYANYLSLKATANEFDMDLSFEEDCTLHAIPTTEKIKYLEQKHNRKLSTFDTLQFIKKKFDNLLLNFDQIAVNPWAQETIKRLVEMDNIVCIASNARVEYIDIVIKMLGVKDEISGRYGNNSGFKFKPEPDMFVDFAQKFNVPYSDCLIIEDTIENVRIPAELGFKFSIITVFEEIQSIK
mgnify:CR=1 FL=1